MPLFRLSAYTWNVGEIDPISTQELTKLFKLDNDNTTDIFIIGYDNIIKTF